MKVNTLSMPELENLAINTAGIVVESINGSAINQAIADICT